MTKRTKQRKRRSKVLILAIMTAQKKTAIVRQLLSFEKPMLWFPSNLKQALPKPLSGMVFVRLFYCQQQSKL